MCLLLESVLVCPVAEVLCGVQFLADSSMCDVGQQCGAVAGQ